MAEGVATPKSLQIYFFNFREIKIFIFFFKKIFRIDKKDNLEGKNFGS